MGTGRIPLWLNEGMAQFEEDSNDSKSRRKRSIKSSLKQGEFFPLDELFAMNSVPGDNVELFYAQSASVVDYLMTDNIRTNYAKFLLVIKGGGSIDAALKDVYQWKYKNGVADLEKRWQDFVRKKY